MSQLIDLTARRLAEAISAGRASAVEATKAYLAAIDARDPAIRAYNETFTDRAIARATAVDDSRAAGEPLGPLAGVPVAVKDNMATDYGRTTCSSRILKDFRAPYTATAVARLESAGAVVLGKTNMDEFAMGSSTENSGFAPTYNPWDTARVPGGSSGGSAAAVAGRLCAAALGSDTGGSIRQPAALCGVTGLKPTYGRVSRYGLVAYGSSLDQIGPLTRDVTDAALLTGAIAGGDARDSTCVDRPVPDYLISLDAPIEHLRIGLPKEFFSDALDGEIAAAIDRAVELYKSAGAEVVEVSLPHSRIDVDADGQLSSFAVAAYYVIATAEASSNLARYDGVHYGTRAEGADEIVELYCASRNRGFGREVKRRIMLGTFALSGGYYDAYYLKASKVRTLLTRDFEAAFREVDVIASAVSPYTAFKLGEKIDDPLAMYLADVCTIPASLAGVAALSIPCGSDRGGLPIGLQLTAPHFGEARLLAIGHQFQRLTDHHTQRPLPR